MFIKQNLQYFFFIGKKTYFPENFIFIIINSVNKHLAFIVVTYFAFDDFLLNEVLEETGDLEPEA